MTVELRELDLSSRAEWREFVEAHRWVGKDVYFLPEWYATWEESGYGKAWCLYAEINGCRFLYPFLLNKIEGYELPGEFYDVETAYGYGGVIFCGKPTSDIISRFNRQVDQWLADHSVVAEMLRLSPFLNMVKIRDCDYCCVRKDVFLDCQGQSRELIWNNVLSCKTRNMIRKAQRVGIKVVITEDIDKSLPEFSLVYTKAAKRLTMDRFYRFPERYFLAVQRNMRAHCFTATAYIGGDLAASSVWINYAGCVHYYLGATDDEFMRQPFWGATLIAIGGV